MGVAATRPKILIVDDVPTNIELLAELLQRDYETLAAINGRDALEIAATEHPDLILLDIIMPHMDGYQVCGHLKANRATCDIPVVFITASTSTAEIVKGFEVGAFHYLTKPLNTRILMAIIQSTLADLAKDRALREKIRQSADSMANYLEEGVFRIQTVEDAYALAVLLAQTCPAPERAVSGLQELLVNAVEHGNLGISYEEKSFLNERGIWDEEITRRLSLADHAHKRVTVRFERTRGEIRFQITDEGAGFDWQPYLTFDPARVFDTHGRGIAVAANTSLDRVEYRGRGNEVLAVVVNRDHSGL